MPRPHRYRPSVEGLEWRDLLSVAGRPAVVSIQGQASDRELRIRGVLRLADSVQPSVGDFGPTHSLGGQGRLAGLGPVRASAAIQSPGFILNGHAQGYLTLKADRGSVTLFLQSDQPQDGPTLPRSFRYVVTGGTGGLVGSVGKGTAFVSAGHRGIRMMFQPATIG